MTTRRGGYEVPTPGINLDRLLTRTVLIPGMVLAGTTYRYTERDSSFGDINGQGEYFPDGDTWYMHVRDADGDSLPAADSLSVGDEVTITGAEGYNHTTTLAAYGLALNPLGQPLADVMKMTLGTHTPTLPTAPEVVITLPTGGMSAPMEGEQKVWCALRDFTGRDQINISDHAFFALGDTRVIVRADDSWTVMDTFTLDGVDYTVRGIARVGGRKQYLELLSRGTV